MKISKILPTLFALIIASCTPATSSSSSSISSSSESLTSSENSAASSSVDSSSESSSSATSSSSSSISSSSISSSSIAPSSSSSSSISSNSSVSSSSSLSSSASTSSSSSSSSSSGEETVNLALMSAPLYIPATNNDDCVSYKVWDLDYAIKDENTFIPYMSLQTALLTIYDDVEVIKEGNKITYTCPYDIVFTVDHEENTITAHNFDNIIASDGGERNIFHMTDGEEVNTHIKENYIAYQGTEDVVFDLDKYHLDIYKYNDDFYLPFSIVNSITFNMCFWASCNFNGTAFYLLNFSRGAVALNYVGTSFEKDFHNGDYRFKNARNNYDFREYNYNSLMFHLDHSYGFRDCRISDFNDYLTKNHQDIVNNLKSDNETFYCQAVEKLINYVIGDGHSTAGNNASACGASTYTRTGIMSERYLTLIDNQEDLLARRQKVLGRNVPSLRYYRDTAIITFDQFLYYPYEMSDAIAEQLVNYDSFALVYSSMKKINNKAGIKNIYFDLTCNPGGGVIAAIGILGYMTNNVELTTYCALTKTAASQSYKIDTNLDGKFNDEDCLASKYNFFVLTSALSFSCATWFPHLAKENGCATIVGENTSGGACNSYITATPDGKIFRISGIAPRAGFKDNPSAHPDDGVIVDIPLDRDYFYNDEELAYIANNH